MRSVSELLSQADGRWNGEKEWERWRIPPSTYIRGKVILPESFLNGGGKKNRAKIRFFSNVFPFFTRSEPAPTKKTHTHAAFSHHGRLLPPRETVSVRSEQPEGENAIHPSWLVDRFFSIFFSPSTFGGRKVSAYLILSSIICICSEVGVEIYQE